MGLSTVEYLIIRASIVFLHWLTPLCVLVSIVILVFRPYSITLPFAVEAWLALETAFYLFVYFPLKWHLQKPAAHPELATREKRRLLFQRCMENIPDPEKYISRWFMDSPKSDIKRENVKHFLRWAFLMMEDVDEAYEEEVEEYTVATELSLGRKLEPGYGSAKCLRLTFDKVQMLHRSLFWYLLVFIVDCSSSVRLWYHNFEYHRTPLWRFFSVFPLRPHNLLAKRVSPSNALTYWYRPHTSKTKLPVLFIHGVGIGLYPYVKFLDEINSVKDDTTSSDGEVGIIALELMSVSFRITERFLTKASMCAEINKILEAHGWDQVVLVSHSYGSVVTTHLLQTSSIASKIGPVMLVDPVTFLLHLPDVAYNFLCRKPTMANEYRLDYFASKDIGIAHTISRTFFWSENIIWKADLRGRRVTVFLGGRDLIVNTEHVGRYLTDADATSVEKETWKSRAWKGDGVDLVWSEDLDHAEIFDYKATRRQMLDVLWKYCALPEGEDASETTKSG